MEPRPTRSCGHFHQHRYIISDSGKRAHANRRRLGEDQHRDGSTSKSVGTWTRLCVSVCVSWPTERCVGGNSARKKTNPVPSQASVCHDSSSKCARTIARSEVRQRLWTVHGSNGVNQPLDPLRGRQRLTCCCELAVVRGKQHLENPLILLRERSVVKTTTH